MNKKLEPSTAAQVIEKVHAVMNTLNRRKDQVMSNNAEENQFADVEEALSSQVQIVLKVRRCVSRSNLIEANKLLKEASNLLRQEISAKY